MTLGQKIQQLRKEHQLSQEKLAESLYVSRQALSKWELGTSMPDLDKIVLLSNYFNVTTDYLLKENNFENDTEQLNSTVASKKIKLSWQIPFVVSTALTLIGLLIAFTKMADGTLPVYWIFSASLYGVVIQVIGITLFEVFYFLKKYEVKYQIFFWSINAFIVTLIPCLFIMNLYFRYFRNDYTLFQYFKFVGLFYLSINMLVLAVCIGLYKQCCVKQK